MTLLFGFPDGDSTDAISISRRNRWVSLTDDVVMTIIIDRLAVVGDDATAVEVIVADALSPSGSLEGLAPLLAEAFGGEFALASKSDGRLALHFASTDDVKVFVVRHLAYFIAD